MEPNVKCGQIILGDWNFTKYVIIDGFVIENWQTGWFELPFASLETLFRWRIISYFLQLKFWKEKVDICSLFSMLFCAKICKLQINILSQNFAKKLFLFAVMILITIAGWLPQVLDFFKPGLITLSPVAAYVICTIGLLYYMFSVGLFLTNIGSFLRKKYGKATTLRIWEIFVSICKRKDFFL